ncbi:MAG: diaminopropionate ammonia-lyase, partial [bacterium]
MTDIFYITNPNSRRITDSEALAHLFSPSVAQSVRRFHQSLPKYEPTPLVSLNHLAHNLQVSNIWIKDESFRFGLNAFKVLGASYAVAYILAQKINTDEHKLTFDLIQSHNDKEIRAITLAAATDGNHGRAVAWAAQQLGCKAVVYMPTGSSLIRFNAIKAHGAEAHIIEGNYDDAVHFAAKQAQKNGWVLVQDTSWEGYEEIPIRIMQGYLTIIDEALEQLEGDTPTHIFVQCGVGSLAAASQAYVLELFGVDRPTFVVVEPLQAACFYKSMAEYDGDPKKVSGDLNTIMAGLACGEPSVL